MGINPTRGFIPGTAGPTRPASPAQTRSLSEANSPAPSDSSGQNPGIPTYLGLPPSLFYGSPYPLLPMPYPPPNYNKDLDTLTTLSSVSNLASGTDDQGNPLFSKQDLTDLAAGKGRFASATQEQQQAAGDVLGNQQLETALDQANADGTFDAANEDDWYNLTAMQQHSGKIAERVPPSVPPSFSPDAINLANPASATAEGTQAEEPPKPEQEQAPASE